MPRPDELVWVEMERHVAQFIQVMDLEMGARYALTPDSAQKLIAAGAAKAVPAPKPARLEAAALAAPGRRG